MARYWSLLANPSVYDVEGALAALPSILWNVGRMKVPPAPGENLLVWRTLGRDQRRGIIALGVVAGEAYFTPDEEDPFWHDLARSGEIERRVPIQWEALAEPLWLTEETAPVLSELKCSRSQGHSMLSEDPEAWNAAVSLAGQVRPPRTSGQGWRQLAAQRDAIEDAAMLAATKHYSGLGYAVEDVSGNSPYDLRCVRPDDEVHVEVKGTTSAGERVLLTAGEVVHAQETEHPALFVLSDLRLAVEADQVLATGGRERVLDPWRVDPGALRPLTYEYRLP